MITNLSGFIGSCIKTGREYDRQLGLVAQLAGIVQTEEQARYQENECTNPGSIKRATAAAAAEGQNGDTALRRHESLLKAGLTISEIPLPVSCTICGSPRLDIQPYWFVPNGRTAPRINSVYVAPYVECRHCKMYRNFQPIDPLYRWEKRRAFQTRIGAIWRVLKARGFTEGRLLENLQDITVIDRYNSQAELAGVRLVGELAPKTIEGSEVFIRVQKRN